MTDNSGSSGLRSSESEGCGVANGAPHIRECSLRQLEGHKGVRWEGARKMACFLRSKAKARVVILVSENEDNSFSVGAEFSKAMTD